MNLPMTIDKIKVTKSMPCCQSLRLKGTPFLLKILDVKRSHESHGVFGISFCGLV